MARYPSLQKSRARVLRKSLTDVENKLWSQLRGRQVSGVKFRRQHPIGPFLVDFCCVERGLVVSWMVVSMPKETLRTNDEEDLSNDLGIESYDFGITKCSLIFMACWKESVKRWRTLALSHRNGLGNDTREFIL
jgi:hypothetical protein